MSNPTPEQLAYEICVVDVLGFDEAEEFLASHPTQASLDASHADIMATIEATIESGTSLVMDDLTDDVVAVLRVYYGGDDELPLPYLSDL